MVLCPHVFPAAGAAPPVRVQDAHTSLTVTVINAPTCIIEGTDERCHVACEVELQNVSSVPATIQKVDVVDARSHRM
jgi:hypothetical protein